MRPDVIYQLSCFLHREFQFINSHKLRPPEAEGTIRMTGLPTRRKEQHRFSIFMLHAPQFMAVDRGDIVLHLAGGMRVQFSSNQIYQRSHSVVRLTSSYCICHEVEMPIGKHPSL